MGAHVSRTDFEWVYTEEPHATRRKEILGESENIRCFIRSICNGNSAKLNFCWLNRPGIIYGLLSLGTFFILISHVSLFFRVR